MSVYRISLGAEDDLNQIADHIANSNPGAAHDVTEAIPGSLQTPATNPGIGQNRDDLRPGLRIFPVRQAARNFII